MVLLAERNATVRERLLRLNHSGGHTVESFGAGRPLLARLARLVRMADLLGLREAA